MNQRAMFLATMLSIVSVGGAVAQNGAPDTNALTAQSAALTPDQKAQAQQLFATAFSLWQSGDFAAAEIGFKKGLDIDPANASANYYYGDCLARRKDKAEAKDYLTRAVALGGNTAEGLKAQAELQQLSTAPTSVADMTPEEVAAAYLGTWTFKITGSAGTDDGSFTITNDAGALHITGKYYINSLNKVEVDGDKIKLITSTFLIPDIVFEGQLVSPTRMEGMSRRYQGGSNWSAIKQ